MLQLLAERFLARLTIVTFYECIRFRFFKFQMNLGLLPQEGLQKVLNVYWVVHKDKADREGIKER